LRTDIRGPRASPFAAALRLPNLRIALRIELLPMAELWSCPERLSLPLATLFLTVIYHRVTVIYHSNKLKLALPVQ
jgi:hypothetical protein